MRTVDEKRCGGPRSLPPDVTRGTIDLRKPKDAADLAAFLADVPLDDVTV